MFQAQVLLRVTLNRLSRVSLRVLVKRILDIDKLRVEKWLLLTNLLIPDLWNTEVQCRIHKGPLIIPILSGINPILRIDTYFFQSSSESLCMFLNKDGFYSVKLLASRLTPKLKDHSWSAVNDCIFNIRYSQLTPISGGLLSHPQPEGTCYTVAIGSHGWLNTTSFYLSFF